MDWLWREGGVALFDSYSLHHFAWFATITLALNPIFRKHTWMGVLSLAISWELFEYYISANILGIPFAGKELWINKWVGDPIVNALGYFTANCLIGIIRKQEKNVVS